MSSEWVTVPREPTDAMLERAVYAIATGTAREVALEHYRAMLAAAPPAPAAEPVAQCVRQNISGKGLMWMSAEAAEACPYGAKLYTAPPPPQASQQQASGEVEGADQSITEAFKQMAAERDALKAENRRLLRQNAWLAAIAARLGEKE